MSVTVNIQGFSDKDDPEFKKHYNAVVFCIENNLSFPIETSEFFKGKVEGGDLEDYKEDRLVEMIENGLNEELPTETVSSGQHYRIKVSDIPKHVHTIIVKLS